MDCTLRGHALRKGRVSLPGQVYLITTVTNDRRPYFRHLRAGLCVVATLIAQSEEGYSKTLAYVVMPDHLHWLMVLEDGSALPEVVSWVKSSSSRRIRALTDGLAGFRWQRGFHDHAIRSNEDLRAAARYVVSNPLRAGLVERIGDYSLWDAAWLNGAAPVRPEGHAVS